MAHHDMHFLGAGRHFGRNGQTNITQVRHFSTTNAGKADDAHLLFTGRFDGGNDVLAIPRCRNANQYISGIPKSFYLSAEYRIVPVVISYGCEDRCIYGQCQCRQAGPFFLEAADDFCCQMLPPFPQNKILWPPASASRIRVPALSISGASAFVAARTAA